MVYLAALRAVQCAVLELKDPGSRLTDWRVFQDLISPATHHPSSINISSCLTFSNHRATISSVLPSSPGGTIANAYLEFSSSPSSSRNGSRSVL